jgi:hypothetical protein
MKPAVLLSFITLVGFALTLPGAPTADATTIVRYDFTGTVTDLTSDSGLFGLPSTSTVGDSFSGHFSYVLGPGNPDQLPVDPLVGLYDGLSFVIDTAIIPVTEPFFITIIQKLPVPGIFPDPGVPGADRLTVRGLSSAYASNIRLTLQAPFGSVFSDDSLPTDLVLADFTEIGNLRGIQALGLSPAPNIEDVGILTSLTRTVTEVSEPGTIVILGIGLAGLGFARRKRIAS